MESSMEIPQKKKKIEQYNPAIPLLGMYPREYVSGYDSAS
jgi:hypothetical protein